MSLVEKEASLGDMADDKVEEEEEVDVGAFDSAKKKKKKKAKERASEEDAETGAEEAADEVAEKVGGLSVADGGDEAEAVPLDFGKKKKKKKPKEGGEEGKGGEEEGEGAAGAEGGEEAAAAGVVKVGGEAEGEEVVSEPLQTMKKKKKKKQRAADEELPEEAAAPAPAPVPVPAPAPAAAPAPASAAAPAAAAAAADAAEGEDDGEGDGEDVPGDDDDAFDEEAGEIELGGPIKLPWEDSDRDYFYEELLGRVFDILRAKNPELAGDRRRTIMRPPQVLREGTKKTVFVNFMDLCKIMHRQPEHVMSFLLAELGTSGSLDGQQRLVVKGRFAPKNFEGLLRRYITEYVLCSMCKSPDTILSKENRLNFVRCQQCGSHRSVQQIKAGFQARVKRRERTG